MSRDNRARVFVQLHKLLLLSTILFCLAGCEEAHTEGTQHPEAYQRQHQFDVRVMSWNVKLTSIFPPDGARHESFARIVRAIEPDVIGLQEIMLPDQAENLAQLMNRYVPLDKGESWQVHTVADNALISRFALRQRSGELIFRYPYPELGHPDFHYGYAAALIDIPDNFGGADLYMIAMHNKSGAGEKNLQLRQLQSDTIARWIRNLRKPGRADSISNNTPVVILGDMNVMPNAPMQPFNTLLSGDIVDEKTFGPDFMTDWDGTDMADARPSHNGKEESYYTWRIDDEPYPPSALDRIIYTDSVLSVSKRFVLNTTTMSAEELTELGLQKSDVLYRGTAGVYDHLPLVADFTLRSGAPD
jgi:endonuclease/exonuclease/phosphatase family metal-dependent hydrolase